VDTKTLQNIFIFRSFGQKDLEKLATITMSKNYSKDSILFYEGEFPKKLYILTDGVISVNKTDAKGNEILLHRFLPTSLIAEMATFQEMNFPATAKFETNGTVLEVDYKPFKEQFISDPKILFEITKSLCVKIKYLEETITTQLTLDSTARVAKFLYENEKVLKSLKQTQIATMLNITPETLSRILRKFKASGVISDSGARFDLLDNAYLKQMFQV
jgi:CRP/FNR family transcriptional regulator